jgi:lipoate-protein ligase A
VEAFRLIDLGRVDPGRAQAFAESVAAAVARGRSPPTILVAQSSRPSISLGFHQSGSVEVDRGFCRRHGVPVLRRVTGGGMIWLDPDQLLYTVVYPPGGTIPAGPPAFPLLLEAPLGMLRSMGVRARLRAPSDLVVHGRKIAGNAGGESEGASIVQGVLLLRANVRAMAGMMRSPHPGFRSVLAQEMARHITSVEQETGRAVGRGLHHRLVHAFRSAPGLRVRDGRPTPFELRHFREVVRPALRSRVAPVRTPGPTVATARVRRVRVAGERYVEAWREAGSSGELWIVVRRFGRAVEAFRAGVGAGRRRARTPVPVGPEQLPDDVRWGTPSPRAPSGG